ncbi:acetyltransferase [Caballeronia sp. LjRoot29]|uniref:acetyltransferase n=1 Tax=Caballeronia sp. LjRoot29 TaxID=3342315 RepID=UPI003ECE59D9
MKGIVVIGAGGHAKVCVESLLGMGEAVDFCIGDTPGQDYCLSIPVLMGDENLARLRDEGYTRVFAAIGSNRLRARLADLAVAQGYELVNAISPFAVISPTARLGVGIAIMAGAVINAEAFVGDLAIVNTGACVDHDCRIGKAVHVAPQCGLAGNVTVGIQSFLGIGSRVIPEIHIGSEVMIGAGSVVISDIDDNQTVVGVPARPLIR